MALPLNGASTIVVRSGADSAPTSAEEDHRYMHPASTRSRVRRDKVIALIALALIAVLAVYHVSDVRTAWTDFETWWAYFPPLYPGDDYIQVTEAAERQDDWHDRYRAITLGMAIRRAAPGVETVIQPQEMWELWGTSADAPRSWDAPGIKDDYFSDSIARAERVPKAYDPVLDAATIAVWESDGIVEHVAWNVAYLAGAEDDTVVVLHTDEARAILYVVPASLSPAGGDL